MFMRGYLMATMFNQRRPAAAPSAAADVKSAHAANVELSSRPLLVAQPVKKPKTVPVAIRYADYLIFIRCCGFLNLAMDSTLEQLHEAHRKWITANPWDQDELPASDLDRNLYAHITLVKQIGKILKDPKPETVEDYAELEKVMDEYYQQGKKQREQVEGLLDEQRRVGFPIPMFASLLDKKKSDNPVVQKKTDNIVSVNDYYIFITMMTMFGIDDYRNITLKDFLRKKTKVLAMLHPDKLAYAGLPDEIKKEFYKIREEFFILITDIFNQVQSYFFADGQRPMPQQGFDHLDQAEEYKAVVEGANCAKRINLQPVHYCVMKVVENEASLLARLLPSEEAVKAQDEKALQRLAEMRRSGCSDALEKAERLVEHGSIAELTQHKADLDRYMLLYRDQLNMLPDVDQDRVNESISTVLGGLSQQPDSSIIFADDQGHATSPCSMKRL